MKSNEIEPDKPYTRIGDMDRYTALNIMMQNDGDMIVWIGTPYAISSKAVEFCTIGQGGGRSDHTFYALRELAKAIKKDNGENPIFINNVKVGE